MRINATLRVVLLAAATRQTVGFGVRPTWGGTGLAKHYCVPQRQLRLFATSDGIQLVGKDEMEEILKDFERGENSGYVVLDVRNPEEVESTGKLSPNVVTCPLSSLKDALQMDSEEFKSTYGCAKPTPDDTVVFSCAAGKRAQMAAEMLKDEYPKCVVYTGGAKEWFE
jgi:rhodanese-related sulfurtransferase